MRKILFLVAVIACVSTIALWESTLVRATAAASGPQFQNAPTEGKGCTVPKAWGQLKGVADRSVAFEDAAGTIRVVDTGPCMRGRTQLIVIMNRP